MQARESPGDVVALEHRVELDAVRFGIHRAQRALDDVEQQDPRVSGQCVVVLEAHHDVAFVCVRLKRAREAAQGGKALLDEARLGEVVKKLDQLGVQIRG